MALSQDHFRLGEIVNWVLQYDLMRYAFRCMFNLLDWMLSLVSSTEFSIFLDPIKHVIRRKPPSGEFAERVPVSYLRGHSFGEF